MCDPSQLRHGCNSIHPIACSAKDARTMEEVMIDVVFSKPVVLRLPGIGARKVATSYEAIECLENEWPDWARGRSWRNACIACRNALDGWCSEKGARRSFEKAAVLAGLLETRRTSADRPYRPVTDARMPAPVPLSADGRGTRHGHPFRLAVPGEGDSQSWSASAALSPDPSFRRPASAAFRACKPLVRSKREDAPHPGGEARP